MPSNVSHKSRWGILIYLFLLSQIGMSQPSGALLGKFHPGTKHGPGVSLRNFSIVVVSLSTPLQVCCPDVFL